MGSLRSQSWGSLRSPQESGGFPKTCKFSWPLARSWAREENFFYRELLGPFRVTHMEGR